MWMDEVTDGWVREQHVDAGRLINHAERQYETNFALRYSRRRWAKPLEEKQSVAGVSGYIWHAGWFSRGGRSFELERFWRDIEPYHPALLMVCSDSPNSIEVSFAAVEDSKTIGNAIGGCFDAALFSLDSPWASSDYTKWREQYTNLDPRVQVDTPWSLIDESMEGLSVFGA